MSVVYRANISLTFYWGSLPADRSHQGIVTPKLARHKISPAGPIKTLSKLVFQTTFAAKIGPAGPILEAKSGPRGFLSILVCHNIYGPGINGPGGPFMIT